MDKEKIPNNPDTMAAIIEWIMNALPNISILSTIGNAVLMPINTPIPLKKEALNQSIKVAISSANKYT